MQEIHNLGEKGTISERGMRVGRVGGIEWGKEREEEHDNCSSNYIKETERTREKDRDRERDRGEGRYSRDALIISRIKSH